MSLRRVLIVDQHDDGARRVRDFLADVAALRPEDVDHAGSTEEALRRLGTGAYDLCIVDDRAGGSGGAIANANPAMAQMLGFASVEALIGSDAVEPTSNRKCERSGCAAWRPRAWSRGSRPSSWPSAGRQVLQPRVLFMSGYTDEAIGRQGVPDRETHFIQKPFSADALLRKVREVLDQGVGA